MKSADTIALERFAEFRRAQLRRELANLRAVANAYRALIQSGTRNPQPATR